MRVLILGGTVFVGRYIAAEALHRGHSVTLFNRGSRPCPFPGVEVITGDRRRDLARLADRSWDACVDTSGYVPGQVHAAAALLAAKGAHYTFVSTLSVYADSHRAEFDESSPLETVAPAKLHDLEALEPKGSDPSYAYGGAYGALKALCEAAVAKAAHGHCLAVRAGVIVGPHDYTDLFTYWPTRVAEGGDVLAPGSPDSQIQLIDVRDLADWIVKNIEIAQTGTFNVTGPRIPIGTILKDCQEVANPTARLVWVRDEFLATAGVIPWVEIPLWIPATIDPGAAMRANTGAASRVGLRCRPLRETIEATLAWDRTRSPTAHRMMGLTRGRERELLEAWRAEESLPMASSTQESSVPAVPLRMRRRR